MFLTGSDILIYRMLYNLVENAIKYNHEGGYVKVKVKKNQNQVQISIEDNGIGIKKEEIERIFERFYKEGKAEGSTGLGLALVDSICKAYHLTLSYTFEDGQHIFSIVS